jgi:hypothetical protein
MLFVDLTFQLGPRIGQECVMPPRASASTNNTGLSSARVLAQLEPTEGRFGSGYRHMAGPPKEVWLT